MSPKEQAARVVPMAPTATEVADSAVAQNNLRVWRAVARPPVTALKTIKGGRLQGMTDVNPQWRYQAMTEQFGPIGDGWKYEIDKLWTEPGCDGEVLGFAQVSLRYLSPRTGMWSDPIVGIGGNHLIVKESKGLRNNDECWKMAITDALSVALKMLGVAADIYAGLWDGSKFHDAPEQATSNEPDGFADWLTDLEAVAMEGTEALKAAWLKSQPYMRKYLTDTNNAKWEALKAKAAKVPAHA
jgi:hypothetical protein